MFQPKHGWLFWLIEGIIFIANYVSLHMWDTVSIVILRGNGLLFMMFLTSIVLGAMLLIVGWTIRRITVVPWTFFLPSILVFLLIPIAYAFPNLLSLDEYGRILQVGFTLVIGFGILYALPVGLFVPDDGSSLPSLRHNMHDLLHDDTKKTV